MHSIEIPRRMDADNTKLKQAPLTAIYELRVRRSTDHYEVSYVLFRGRYDPDDSLRRG